MATPAPRGDWLRTFRGLTVITHPQFIRWFLGTVARSRATRRRPEFNP
jgi:hypothetical protein